MTPNQRLNRNNNRALAAIVAIAILAPPIATYASDSPWWVCLIGWGICALIFLGGG